MLSSDQGCVPDADSVVFLLPSKWTFPKIGSHVAPLSKSKEVGNGLIQTHLPDTSQRYRGKQGERRLYQKAGAGLSGYRHGVGVGLGRSELGLTPATKVNSW